VRQPRLRHPGYRAAAVLLTLLAAGCARQSLPSGAVPPFAAQGFEPFSRAAAIAVAQREWRLFGAPIDDDPPGQRAAPAPDDMSGRPSPDDKPERQDGLWQRVGEYWWIGLNGARPDAAWTGKHDQNGKLFPPAQDGDYAWSAAFISYVMRIAGARDRFPYSGTHADYINAARRGSAGLRAWPPEIYAPQPGDLICLGRGDDASLRFDDLPVPRFPGHCDIVVGADPGQLDVIGGNVDDAVTLKHVPLTGDGHLATAAGTVVDQRYPWFVVLQVFYQR
jgi:hypothetical protein